MAISFDQIPSDIRVPFAYVEFSPTRSSTSATILKYTSLVMGQMLTAGTATPDVPVLVTSADQAKTLFGQGSMLHHMAQAYFQDNKYTETWFLPVSDSGGGAAATGQLTITGPATAAGTIYLYIGGRLTQVAVANGDTASAIATAVAAALTANADLPVTAAVNGTDNFKVDLTARHKGTLPNTIDVRVNYQDDEALPSGVAISVTAMSGGSGDPTLTTAIANMGDEWYNVIAFPWTDATNLTAIETELLDRAGPLRMIDGVAIGAKSGNLSALQTLGASRNSQYMSISGLYNCPTPSYEVAANNAGVAAYYLPIDPARPLQTLPLTWVKPPKPVDRFTTSERNTLLYDGIATVKTDAGGVVRIENQITTYQTNALGADDDSYLQVNSVATLMYLRYDFRTYFAIKYPRHKLASDAANVGPGQAIITPKVAKAESIALFRSWESKGLVEDVDQFKADLVVEIDAANPNRLNFLLPPNLVNQFRILAAQIQFRT